MRRAALLLVAVIVAGCTSKSSFQLNPDSPDLGLGNGPTLVRRDSGGVFTEVVYERSVAGVLVFDVTVVNHSDSTAVVDPEAYGYTVAIPGVRAGRSLRRRTAALGRDRALSALDGWVAQEQKRYDRQSAGRLAIGLADLVADLAQDHDDGEHECACCREQRQMREAEERGEAIRLSDEAHESEMRRRTDLRTLWMTHALPRAALAPGDTLRGKLALPARALDALADEVEVRMADNTRSLKAPKLRVRLTLDGPFGLDTRPIGYRVLRW